MIRCGDDNESKYGTNGEADPEAAPFVLKAEPRMGKFVGENGLAKGTLSGKDGTPRGIEDDFPHARDHGKSKIKGG